jgi:ferritin-like protein
VEPLLQFFEYSHLPEHLQVISKEFHSLANTIVNTLPKNPERTVSLRKLLEAKDCAVRAAIFKEVAGVEYVPFRKANTSARSGLGIPKTN